MSRSYPLMLVTFLWPATLLAECHSLVDAAEKGDIAAVISLLNAGADPNCVTDSNVKGWTPLMAAAKAGSTEVAQALLKAGANVNATNEYGATPLDLAANHGYSSDIAVAIFAAGGKGRDNYPISASSQSINGGSATPAKTPPPMQAPSAGPAEIHGAPAVGDLEKLTTLLKENPSLKDILDGHADINATDSNGMTALHRAAKVGNKELAELLLTVGNKDVRATFEENLRARDKYVAEFLSLLDGHADINATDTNGMTALHWAAKVGNKELTELLLTNHAKGNPKDKDGHTPLDLAVLAAHEDVAEVLRGTGKPAKLVGREPLLLLRIDGKLPREFGMKWRRKIFNDRHGGFAVDLPPGVHTISVRYFEDFVFMYEYSQHHQDMQFWALAGHSYKTSFEEKFNNDLPMSRGPTSDPIRGPFRSGEGVRFFLLDVTDKEKKVVAAAP